MKYKTLKHKTLLDTFGVLNANVGFKESEIFHASVPDLMAQSATLEALKKYLNGSPALEQLDNYDLVDAEISFPKDDNDFSINPNDKFYPEANVWMWNYCTFLGKYTDSKGVNYDLGVYFDDGEIYDATVAGPEPGNYFSSEIRREDDKNERRREVYRRLKVLNLNLINIPKN